MTPQNALRCFKALFSCALWICLSAAHAAAPIELTPEEASWLAQNHTVRIRVGHYPPYNFNKPVPTGMAIDYVTAAAARAGVRIELVPSNEDWNTGFKDVTGPRRRYDALLLAFRTPEREQQLAFTQQFLSAPWVIYAQQDGPYLSGVEALRGKVVALEAGFVIVDKLRRDYPEVQIREMKSSLDALLEVATRQADAYIGNLAVSNFLVRANQLHNLVVAAPTPFGMHSQGMAVRKDWQVVAGLLDKGLATMTTDERIRIDQKWGVIEFKDQIDYTLVWEILAAASFILLVFLYWNRKLAAEIGRRKLAEVSAQESAARLAAERDLLEQRVTERTKELTEALKFNESVLLNSPLPMAVYDENGQCVMVNEAFAALMGANREQLLAQNFNRLESWKKTTLLGDALAALKFHSPEQRECHMVTSFGKAIWIEYRILPQFLSGQRHLLIQLFDLTERKRVENELRDAATHDFLTGLPNRRLLLDRLERALRVSRRQNTYLAVLFLDLDKFKLLNDTQGHDAGDKLLKEVAGRLQSELRDSDTVARIGGDEFVVLLEGLGPTRESAVSHSELIAGKLRASTAVEYDLDGIPYHGSISIGIRIYNGNNASPDGILKDADTAMYKDKRSH
jgi:diguanylate cyclase (GGDEF)-like protein/PAS domain S-box-containing protein